MRIFSKAARGLTVLFLLARPACAQFPGICGGNCLVNTAFTNSCAMPVTTSDGCTTWSGDCSGWFVSHGAPQENQNGSWVVEGKSPCENVHHMSLVHEVGTNPDFPGNGGSGIYTSYNFTAGQSYDVRIIYTFAIDFFVPNRGANGMVNLVAANNLRPAPLAGCRGQIPTAAIDPGLTVQSIRNIGLSTPGGTFDQVFTFTANANYSQFWIYPQGANFGATGNPNIRLFVYSVFVCPSCPASTVIYNSGSLPASTTAGTVFIGTSAPENGNGTGTVTVQSSQATSVLADEFIQIDKNFTASITGAGIVNFSTFPCTSPATSHRPDLFDSTSDILGFVTVQSLHDPAVTSTTSEAFALAGSSPPVTTSLRIYPTLTPGGVTLTGSPADLEDANIIVTDASGRTVYRMHNDSGSPLTLDLSKLTNGIYFLQIKNNVRTTTQKIVISK